MFTFYSFMDRCMQAFNEKPTEDSGLVKFFAAWTMARTILTHTKKKQFSQTQIQACNDLWKKYQRARVFGKPTMKFRIAISILIGEFTNTIYEAMNELKEAKEMNYEELMYDKKKYPGTIGTSVKAFTIRGGSN